MKTRGLSAVLVALTAGLLLFAFGAGAHAGDDDLRSIHLEMLPARPTHLDSLEFVVDVTLPHSCYDVELLSFDVASDEVVMSLRADEMAACPPDPFSFQVTRPVGRLPVGRYHLEAKVGGHYSCEGGQCGYSTVTISPSPGFRVLAVGDADCSESVDSIDASVVLQYSARLFNALYCALPSDANRDGEVQSTDATLILQYTAGLLRQLPPG